jgi:molecular chaperone GrpE (heat shock protein)
VVPGGSNPAGTVAEQLRPGYRFRDEVLRPARVRVAQ